MTKREKTGPRRGLSRVEAADYVGVSARKFDAMVIDKRMPGPKLIDARKVWDMWTVDFYFEHLDSQEDEVKSSFQDRSWKNAPAVCE